MPDFDGNQPTRDRWILARRSLNPDKEIAYYLLETDLKSDASERDVGLADQVAEALRAQRDWQQGARERAGSAWVESGLVFTTADGEGLHPAKVSARFKQLAREPGCHRSGCTP